MGIVWPFIPARLWPHGKGSPGARAVRGAVYLQHCFPTESSHESKSIMGTQSISQTDV